MQRSSLLFQSLKKLRSEDIASRTYRMRPGVKLALAFGASLTDILKGLMTEGLILSWLWISALLLELTVMRSFVALL